MSDQKYGRLGNFRALLIMGKDYLTVKVYVPVEEPFVFVAVIVKVVAASDAVGVPLIRPVDVLKVRPAGSVPPLIAYEVAALAMLVMVYPTIAVPLSTASEAEESEISGFRIVKVFVPDPVTRVGAKPLKVKSAPVPLRRPGMKVICVELSIVKLVTYSSINLTLVTPVKLVPVMITATPVTPDIAG